MEVSKENRLELAVCNSTVSFQELLDSQKELFQSQTDKLHSIVFTQCKLTGVNPLSQEMAAGSLSIRIGKRPRDLLNPKAVKYMQSVFSIKDGINKKESREISSLFGVTATQVREFFTNQRARVRKFVRVAKEKADRSNECKEAEDGFPSSSHPDRPIDPVPLSSVVPINTEEGPSCSTQDEILPGIDDSDKNFLENIFSLMRKEDAFSGQVKLMEWILQIQKTSVLCWFLTKGGVMILATWLSQAAIEEQTSVLHVILKVLCHLPLQKALPVHMSAILQSVNKLRFYRASDISNRARILLSRWSKIFARTQAMKKPNAMKSSCDVQDEMLLKQSINEIMANESWESKVDISEKPLTLTYGSSENFRKLESPLPLKLLTASPDDSNKKLGRGVSSSQFRERRKVQLVEQPGQKTAGRSSQVARFIPATRGRPLSADDIQKAKMRAQFMQSKYGKMGTPSDDSVQVKTEGLNKGSSSQASILLSASKANVQPKIEEQRKPLMSPSKVFNMEETPLDTKMNLDLEEPLWKKCKKVQIPWQTPPDVRIGVAWSVSKGENSKEVEVQNNRIRREKEIIYKTMQDIPLNPKEPWDREMDHDDTLTPEIPTEQLPDADGAETVVSPRENEQNAVTSASTSFHDNNGNMSQDGNGNMPEPDLELLAVLLKNPELVFALTSAQSSNLSNDETVRLLDMIKANGMNQMGSLGRKAEEKVEVSLPSPTPSSNPVTSGWRSEPAKNPFSRQNAAVNREAYALPGVASQKNLFSSNLVHSQISQQPATMPQVSQLSLPRRVNVLPDKHQSPVIHSLNQSVPNFQTPTSEIVLNINNSSFSSLSFANLLAAGSPSIRVETSSNVKTPPEKPPAAFPSHPSMPPSMVTRPQPQLQSPEPQSWRPRQGSASNPHYPDNQKHYYGSGRGPQQPGPRGRAEFTGEPRFESWSPENSPMRSPGYMPGWNHQVPRGNLGRGYVPERSRPRNPSGYWDHNNRNGNKRWLDRRR